MLFWISALIMIVGATLCVIVPLSGPSKDGNEQSAVDVYTAQLMALDPNSPNDEAERVEISRRLLKASKEPSPARKGSGRSKFAIVVSSLLALVFVPASSLGLYLSLGSPQKRDVPFVAQGTNTPSTESLPAMISMAEQHLSKNPDDVKGWEVLANVYGRTNQLADRVRALKQIIRISGSTPQRQVDLAEALISSQNNQVPAEATAQLTEALEIEPDNLRAATYLAIAAEQDGRREDALAAWQVLAKRRLDDSKWQDMTASRIAALSNTDAPESSTGEEQAEMINNMVNSLASKLRDEPDNLPGWKRLIRSYIVLENRTAATTALQTARSQFATNPAALEELAMIAKSLNLQN